MKQINLTLFARVTLSSITLAYVTFVLVSRAYLILTLVIVVFCFFLGWPIRFCYFNLYELFVFSLIFHLGLWPNNYWSLLLLFLPHKRSQGKRDIYTNELHCVMQVTSALHLLHKFITWPQTLGNCKTWTLGLDGVCMYLVICEGFVFCDLWGVHCLDCLPKVIYWQING